MFLGVVNTAARLLKNHVAVKQDFDAGFIGEHHGYP